MNTQDVIRLASQYLDDLSGHIFDLLDISRPISSDAAVNLAKVISKLSPLLGNLIEFNTVEFLNEQEVFASFGEWKRQDPGFPDTVFIGSIQPTPGLEIKAWFPLDISKILKAYHRGIFRDLPIPMHKSVSTKNQALQTIPVSKL